MVHTYFHMHFALLCGLPLIASAMVFKYVTIRLSKESLNQCQLQMPDLWRILQD